jgi:hypothetical protein
LFIADEVESGDQGDLVSFFVGSEEVIKVFRVHECSVVDD